jgi:plasmid stabilization system protein ParE
MRLRVARLAEEDLINGFRYYARRQEGLGDYFLDSLSADIDALSLYAGIHPKPFGRFHRTLAKRFPFAVYYEVDAETVTIVAVLDCRQNPGAIRKRVG